MWKKIVSVFSLAFLIILIIFNYFFPVAVFHIPEFTVRGEALESYRHLRLGVEYEKAGDFVQAEKEYSLAALSKNPRVSQEAQNALRRVMRIQENPFITARLYVRNATKYTIIALVVILFLFLILRTVRILARKPGFSISKINDNVLGGKGGNIQSLLYIDIQKIKEVYSHKVDGLQFRFGEVPFIFTSNSLLSIQEDVLQVIDNLLMGQNQILNGMFLGTILRFIFQTEYIVYGEVFRSSTTANAYLEIVRTNDNVVIEKIFHSTETTNDVENEQLNKLVDDLAYKLVFTLSGRNNRHAQSWQSFQLFTKALEIQNNRPVTDGVSAHANGPRNLLLKTLEFDPTYYDAEYLLGLVYNCCGQYRDARNIFRKLKRNPEYNIEATYHLGISYLQEHQAWANEKARSCFEEIIFTKLDASGDRKGRMFLALSYCGLANVIAQQSIDRDVEVLLGEIEKLAHEALILVGDLDEIVASIEFARGTLFMRREQYEFAIGAFTKSITHFPYNATTYINLAKCHLDNNPEEAEFWLKQAAKFLIEQDYIKYLLGRAYEKLDFLDEAKDVYQAAVKNSDAQNRLGEILADEMDYGQALLCFKRSTKINSRHVRAWGNLAWWAIQNNQLAEHEITPYNQIVEWAKRSLTLNMSTPFEWLSRDTLGLAQLYNHKYFEAESEIRKSIAKKDDKIQNRYHLALLYKMQGKVEEAIREIQNSLQLDDKSLWRDKAQQLLFELKQNNNT